MSRQSEFIARSFAGREITSAQLREYYAAFHEQRPKATEFSLRRLRTADGETSYDLLTRLALAAGPARLLDVGCGDGALLRHVLGASDRVRVSGIDLSSAEIERARSSLPGERVDMLVAADATEMPLASTSFDAVASHQVFMLVPEIERLLAEVRRVLMPGGTLAFLIAGIDRPADRVADLYGRIHHWIRELHGDYAPINPADPRIVSESGTRALLQDAGFTQGARFEYALALGTVHSADIWSFLVQRYYVGSLADDEAAYIRDRVSEWLGDEPLHIREPLRVAIAKT